MRSRSIVASVGMCLLALVLALPQLVVGPAASAQSNPYQRGPNPTLASLDAARGPFAIAQASVPSSVSGFGGGTIYYPTDTSQGTFGAVAVAPGFFESQSAISWYGPRLASHGFVVITMNTNGLLDLPNSRATQLMAALNYLTQSSTVRTRIDSTRLAVMGHSMGGGGTLEAALNNPSLQAAVPLAPWDLVFGGFGGVRVPTMIVGCESDLIAPVASHAEPFYNQIPASSEKAYLEINNAGHFCTNSANNTIARSVISWLKRFVDNDTRYEQFLCPAPTGPTISEYRNTCPH